MENWNFLFFFLFGLNINIIFGLEFGVWFKCMLHALYVCAQHNIIRKMIQRFYVEHDAILGECTNYITPIRKRKTICHCQVGCQAIRKCWISGFATFVMICLSSNCVCAVFRKYILGSIAIYQRYFIACFLNGVKEHPYGKL